MLWVKLKRRFKRQVNKEKDLGPPTFSFSSGNSGLTYLSGKGKRQFRVVDKEFRIQSIITWTVFPLAGLPPIF